MVWIILRHTHMLPISQLLESSLLWHLFITGIFTNLMSTMHSLHGDLQEDVYMLIPHGVPQSHPNQVYKLSKSLYGLKQASRKLYEKLTSLLLSHGYKQTTSDHSLFTKHTTSSFTLLLVYVDDVILVGNSLLEFQSIKTALDYAFKIKDLGILK